MTVGINPVYNLLSPCSLRIVVAILIEPTPFSLLRVTLKRAWSSGVCIMEYLRRWGQRAIRRWGLKGRSISSGDCHRARRSSSSWFSWGFQRSRTARRPARRPRAAGIACPCIARVVLLPGWSWWRRGYSPGCTPEVWRWPWSWYFRRGACWRPVPSRSYSRRKGPSPNREELSLYNKIYILSPNPLYNLITILLPRRRACKCRR